MCEYLSCLESKFNDISNSCSIIHCSNSKQLNRLQQHFVATPFTTIPQRIIVVKETCNLMRTDIFPVVLLFLMRQAVNHLSHYI